MTAMLPPAALDRPVASAAADPSPASKPLAAYEPPEWASSTAHPFVLEVLKEGSSVGTIPLMGRSQYTFGRTPTADCVLEHPSASRLHAILQFGGEDGMPFVYDNASTHGTFVNKRQLKAGMHAPLRVGDLLKFGSSTRLYVLHGPEDMRPPPSRTPAEVKAARLLEAARARAAEASLREGAMAAAALAASAAGGATWGLAADNDDEAEGGPAGGDEPDWRRHPGPWTDTQQGLLDRLRKKEAKQANLQKEIDAINAKEGAQGGLTAGQQAQVGRNEQQLKTLGEEVDDLEDTLNESLAESVRGRCRARGEETPAERRRRLAAAEAEADGSSGDDAFYDRATRRPRGPAGAAPIGAASLESLVTARAVAAAAAVEARHAADAAGEAHRIAEQVSAVELATGDDDPLAAYEATTAATLRADSLTALRKAAVEAEAAEARAAHLVAVADPTGLARERLAKATEMRKRNPVIATARAPIAAMPAVPLARPTAPVPDSPAPAAPIPAPTASTQLPPPLPPVVLAEVPVAAEAAPELRAPQLSAPLVRASLLEIRKRPAPQEPLAGAPPSGRPRGDVAGGTLVQAEQSALADVERLLRGRGYDDDATEAGGDGGDWQAPSGQDGSGRSAAIEKLAAKLGY